MDKYIYSNKDNLRSAPVYHPAEKADRKLITFRPLFIYGFLFV